MNFRCALLTLTLALTAIPVAEGEPPQSSGPVNSVLPALPDGFTYSSPQNGTPYSSTSCCPSISDITQGVAGDCFLLASLAAIASVSPGTIEKAIQPNPDFAGTYTITLHQDKALFGGKAPTVQGPLTTFSHTYNTAFPEYNWWNGIKNNFAPWNTNFAFEAPGPTGALWPMMMEKAYAAMYADGYNAFMDYHDGGNGYWAMRAISGADSDAWLLSPHVATPTLLKSVWVHNVPSAADTAGHSVLGGLLRGDLKAIEPSIEVCVTQQGQKYGVCSPVCKESYTCRTPFGNGGVPLNLTKSTIHVDIVDPSSGSSQRQIASTDKNPADCKEANPCTIDTPSGPVVISFDVGGPQSSVANESAHVVTTTDELAGLLSSLQEEHQAVTLSSRPLCSGQTKDPTCTTADKMYGLEPLHEFYFLRYNSTTQMVTFGDPHNPTQHPIASLAQILDAFRAVYSNAVKATACSCGK